MRMDIIPAIKTKPLAEVPIGNLIRVDWGNGVKLGVIGKTKLEEQQLILFRPDSGDHNAHMHPAQPDSGNAVLDLGANWYVRVDEALGKPGVPDFLARDFCVVVAGPNVYLRTCAMGGGGSGPFYLDLQNFTFTRGGAPFNSEWDAWQFPKWEIRLRNAEPDGKCRTVFNWPLA